MSAPISLRFTDGEIRIRDTWGARTFASATISVKVQGHFDGVTASETGLY